MPAPLANSQKSILAQLANRAYNRERALASGRGEAFTEKPDDFRRRHVVIACGKHGLRCCSQADYGTVKAHFEDLLGNSGQALNTLVRAEGNGRRIAEYQLVEALKKAQLPLSYAAKICQTQYKCTLNDATERQLWCLKFTIQNRARKVTIHELQPELTHA